MHKFIGDTNGILIISYHCEKQDINYWWALSTNTVKPKKQLNQYIVEFALQHVELKHDRIFFVHLFIPLYVEFTAAT